MTVASLCVSADQGTTGSSPPMGGTGSGTGLESSEGSDDGCVSVFLKNRPLSMEQSFCTL